MIYRERLTATMGGDFVVFLIGMRINTLWRVHKWFPVSQSMPRMLSELKAKPELGMFTGELWFGRTTILVQYWRSMDQSLAYATNREATPLPAWSSFNQSVARRGDVGVWHETYAVSPGEYENIYVNVPPFGLGKVGTLERNRTELDAVQLWSEWGWRGVSVTKDCSLLFTLIAQCRVGNRPGRIEPRMRKRRPKP